ncbi:unnamed protein product [Enterobius vermicularis]|uniref:Kinesin motor domain-containing protein n=1 Tax=Enterobius vermicularis TaxID=51028 RepID=A0A0N4USF8_ENTVE|nr:unnamed protein product [Enterobius vermicularis]
MAVYSSVMAGRHDIIFDTVGTMRISPEPFPGKRKIPAGPRSCFTFFSASFAASPEMLRYLYFNTFSVMLTLAI